MLRMSRRKKKNMSRPRSRRDALVRVGQAREGGSLLSSEFVKLEKQAEGISTKRLREEAGLATRKSDRKLMDMNRKFKRLKKKGK
jgi:hypothetical protein